MMEDNLASMFCSCDIRLVCRMVLINVANGNANGNANANGNDLCDWYDSINRDLPGKICHQTCAVYCVGNMTYSYPSNSASGLS
jgi:hypothetical protein